MIIVVGCAREAPVSQTLPPIGSVVVKQSGGAGLFIAECQDKQYILSAADYIVEGIVKRVESNWNEDKSAIFTTTNLSIEKYVKGVPFTEGELQIVTPGGTVGDITQVVEDQPIFHEGKAFRILNIVEEYTRECLAMLVKRRITSQDVIDQLFQPSIFRGIPEHIRSDN